jgi:hypothetical protein
VADALLDLPASPLSFTLPSAASGASAHASSALDSTTLIPLSSNLEPLSCHPRDAGPELRSSTCPGDEAGTGAQPVLGGARYSSSVDSVAPALPAPVIIVPADGTVLKSESLGKDGVMRECGYSKVIFERACKSYGTLSLAK